MSLYLGTKPLSLFGSRLAPIWFQIELLNYWLETFRYSQKSSFVSCFTGSMRHGSDKLYGGEDCWRKWLNSMKIKGASLVVKLLWHLQPALRALRQVKQGYSLYPTAYCYKTDFLSWATPICSKSGLQPWQFRQFLSLTSSPFCTKGLLQLPGEENSKNSIDVGNLQHGFLRIFKPTKSMVENFDETQIALVNSSAKRVA